MLDWYLADWLQTLRVSQADLVRLTDYPKAKVSDLVTGKQRYNRDILNDIARALNLQPHELLMHPEDAMALRQMIQGVGRFVKIPHGGAAGDLPEEKPGRRKTS
jgi:plasmid maintenance system antidote protein VapI